MAGPCGGELRRERGKKVRDLPGESDEREAVMELLGVTSMNRRDFGGVGLGLENKSAATLLAQSMLASR